MILRGHRPPKALETDGAVAVSRQFDFGHLVDLCRRIHERSRGAAARAADTYPVTRNWLFGWYIVEYEQRGSDRAKYGAGLLAKVSHRLQEAGIKGCSTSRLELYRLFYQQHRGIGPTLSDQFASPASLREPPQLVRRRLTNPSPRLPSCPLPLKRPSPLADRFPLAGPTIDTGDQGATGEHPEGT